MSEKFWNSLPADLQANVKQAMKDATDKEREFAANLNNAFDTEYIAESLTNTFVGDGDTAFRGINTRNKVFFGFGRTFNVSARYSF